MNKSQTESICVSGSKDKYDTDFPPILNMEIIRRNALDAIASNERIQAYALFEIYAKSRETLTDREIQELIGFSPPRTGYKYERYKFIRYSKIDVVGNDGKLKKQSTWLIEKFDPIKEAQIKMEQRQIKAQEAKSLEMVTLEDFELDEGLENYRNLKQVMSEV